LEKSKLLENGHATTWIGGVDERPAGDEAVADDLIANEISDIKLKGM
jgi:hypothetical protein